MLGEGSVGWRLSSFHPPAKSLQPGTQYTVTVDDLTKDIEGNAMEKDYAFSFTTESLGVDYVYPMDGATNVYIYSDINVSFNMAIDTSTVRQNFSMSPPASGQFYLYEGSSYFYFDPSDALQRSTTYTVTLGTGIQDTFGNNLEEPYTWSFTTEN